MSQYGPLIERVLRESLSLVPSRKSSLESLDHFNIQVIPKVRNWFRLNDVNVAPAAGLFGLIEVQPNLSAQTYTCYLSFVRRVEVGEVVPKFERPFVESEELVAAAGVIQVLDHPDNIAAIQHTLDLLHEVAFERIKRDRDDLSNQIAWLLDEVKTRRETNRRYAKRTRSKDISELIQWLSVASGGVFIARELWLLLHSHFDRYDPKVRAIFVDKIADNDGLNNLNTLKEAPYKFVFAGAIKTGPRAGQERYMTYKAFREHVRRTERLFLNH